jgi:homoserine dehydrogenase
MTTVSIAFLGYGAVNRALAALLESRRVALRERYDLEYVVTGVATRRLGWIAHADGLDPEVPNGETCADVRSWLERAQPDVVFEAIPLDPHAGQPALDYLRAVLRSGAHAISANKGPVVHAYRELTRMATSVGRRYRFESAVMDGAPVFSLARHCLPLAGMRGIRGVFTSTATIVLEAVGRGATIADGIAEAQRLGIAESDPSYDVDGWDSAVKLCAVANVLLDAALLPNDVARTGITALDAGAVREAAAAGRPYRLVGQVASNSRGEITARVQPEQLAPGDPLAAARGATLVMHYEADVFPGGLTVTSHDPDPTTTAFGMFTDLLDALGAT